MAAVEVQDRALAKAVSAGLAEIALHLRAINQAELALRAIDGRLARIESLLGQLIVPDERPAFHFDGFYHERIDPMGRHWMIGRASWDAAPTDKGIDKRVLAIVEDGSETPRRLEFAPESTGADGIELLLGSTVELAIYHVDQAGNQSDRVTIGPFVVTDTVAPPSVSGFAFQAYDERLENDQPAGTDPPASDEPATDPAAETDPPASDAGIDAETPADE